MELDELLRHELLALIEIHLTGRTRNGMAMHKLLDNGVIVDLHGGRLQLTAKAEECWCAARRRFGTSRPNHVMRRRTHLPQNAGVALNRRHLLRSVFAIAI